MFEVVVGQWICTKRVKCMIEIYSTVQSIPSPHLRFIFPIRKVSTRPFTTRSHQVRPKAFGLADQPLGNTACMLYPRSQEIYLLCFA